MYTLMNRRWMILLAVLAAATPLFAQDGMPPANVRVATASLQSMAPVTLVPGTVVSRNDANLAAEVEGRLTMVADVGTWVSEGDPVARIEDTALKLREAELEAEVTRAEARLTFLDAEVARFERLAESNLAALTQLDQTRSDRDVSRSEIRVARARLDQVRDQLARTVVRAPFDGVVVERLMTPGERVSDNREVVRLVDQHHLEVIARAPLEYYGYVQPGLALELQANGSKASGVVRTVVAVGDENTHQFELRLDLEGSPFPVGKTLRVAVPISDARQVLSVPRDALVLRPGSITVFVVDDNEQARQVPVSTGMGSGDQIEVTGDLSAGDRVVIRGNERLQSGQPVNIQGGQG